MAEDHVLLQHVGRVAGQWWQNAQTAIQGFQSCIAEKFPRPPRPHGQGQGQQQLAQNSNGLSQKGIEAPPPVLDQVHELERWRKNPTWVDEKAIMEISVPKGALCQLSSSFKVGLPPLILYDILIDPGNKRVFKDIQEVKYRTVLEDHGERQIIELEQAAIWRFLWLSGTLSVCVRVDQDRRALKLKYELGREGFMKRFQGSWRIEPLYVDADEKVDERRTASLVTFQQVVEPALLPPPPISWYVRGITRRTMEKLLMDLQAEGKRMRESDEEIGPPSFASPPSIESASDGDDDDAGSEMMQQSALFHRTSKLPDRANALSSRSRKKGWRS